MISEFGLNKIYFLPSHNVRYHSMKIFVTYVLAKSKAKNIASIFIINSSKLFHVQCNDIYLMQFQSTHYILRKRYHGQLKVFVTIDQWRTQKFFSVGGSTNSVEDRENGDLGAVALLVRGSGGRCNLVQEISFHIVKFS